MSSSHAYQPLHLNFEAKQAILHHNSTTTTSDSTSLQPREFKQPDSKYTFWFGSHVASDAGEEKGKGRYIDTRYVGAVAVVVGLVVFMPLIVWTATRKQMGEIRYANENESFDCS